MSGNAEYNNLRVLVTGAGGFIGSHLVEALLRAGARVKAVVRYTSRGSWGHLEHVSSEVRDSMEVILGDVRDTQFLRKQALGCDVIFHLAALIGIPYSYEAAESYVDTNVRGTLNVLQAAREAAVRRVVITSTSEVYGTACYTPMDEKHPLQAQSPYSASKIAADKLAESYHLSFGLPVVTIRPFNTYGPRQSARAVIPTIVSQVLAGVDTLHLGSLDPVRDLTYVEDTVRGFLRAGVVEQAVGQIINLGTGQGISIGDLAHAAMQIVGRKLPIVTEADRVRPPASEVRLLVAKTARARDLLGWEPEVPLTEGLKRVIEYIGANMAAYRVESYAV
ncbi:MAG TPA: SDR family NAD(P)-dependent oxidoreductase [Candidatus Sulfotelmatobacter sp.]|nr:SDR family NAD(P)-dependent oxidoreductase [Candidatus Sulfotelmatobacter sp.]